MAAAAASSSDDARLLGPPQEGAPAEPRRSYAASLLVLLLILLGSTLSLLLQLAVALPTLPLLCCSGGRERFHDIQGRVFHGVLSCVTVGLNPLWWTRCHWIGAAGPPDIVPGSVVFCNHRSNSDPFVASWLLTLSGVSYRYIYKSSLQKVPILGWCGMLAGELAVHFGNKQAIVDMVERAKVLLSQGHHVVLFPEGTRGPSGILQDFKPSFFEICTELNCPAVPMCLVGTERAWPHGGAKMGCATVHMILGEPIMPGAGGAKELSDQIAQKMQDMACEVLESTGSPARLDDPFVTGRPYTYWTPPESIRHLSEEEQMRLLREKKVHEKGAHIL